MSTEGSLSENYIMTNKGSMSNSPPKIKMILNQCFSKCVPGAIYPRNTILKDNSPEKKFIRTL